MTHVGVEISSQSVELSELRRLVNETRESSRELLTAHHPIYFSFQVLPLSVMEYTLLACNTQNHKKTFCLFKWLTVITDIYHIAKLYVTTT